MKLIMPLILSVSLIGCGSQSSSPAATPEPTPTASPTATPAPTATPLPTPTPTPLADTQSIVGNWIDSAGTILAFKADSTAMSGTQALSWSVDDKNMLHFVASKVEVDSCSWQILSAGGLTTPLVITLDLGCLKAGALKYSRAP